MTSRRAYALKLGGRFLAQLIMRRYPNRYRLRMQSRRQVEQQRLVELASEYMSASLPEWMTESDVRDEAARAFIRERFYAAINMTSPMLVRWTVDPRLLDGLPEWRKGIEATKTRQRLRLLTRLRHAALPNGKGWSPMAYDVARECIFVIDAIWHPHFIDYESWVVMQNFGRDWTKPTRYQPSRRLPLDVRLQAELALARYESPVR